MKRYRNIRYKKFWDELLKRDGSRCYYCRKEIATTIDHIIPYSWDSNNSIENCVLACALCNSIAGNKMFDSLEHKRQYILNQRKGRANQRAICTGCLLPFSYRIHSPSFLLCAECYDQEYNTEFSKTKEWHKWIGELRLAGIPAEAHRTMKQRLDKAKVKSRTNDVKLELLIDEYSLLIDSDEEFASLLMVG